MRLEKNTGATLVGISKGEWSTRKVNVSIVVRPASPMSPSHVLMFAPPVNPAAVRFCRPPSPGE